MGLRAGNGIAMTVSGTPGTGAITAGVANASIVGAKTLATAGVVDGDIVALFIRDGNNWEEGEYTYTASGTSLARTRVIGSSNSGSAVSLTSSALLFGVLLAENTGINNAPGFASAQYYFGVRPDPASVQAIAFDMFGGLIYGCPLFIQSRQAFTKLGCQVTTAQAASNGQLGIYRFNAAGLAGKKIISTSSFAMTSTGIKEQTIASTILDPGYYFLGWETDTNSVRLNTYIERATISVFGHSGASGFNSTADTPIFNDTFGTWADNPGFNQYLDYGTRLPLIWVRL